MKTNGIVRWTNLYDLMSSYVANQKFRGLSFQGEANQYLSNVLITFPNVEVNALELFLLKKWASEVVIQDPKPEIHCEFQKTGYTDIDDSLANVESVKSLLVEGTVAPDSDMDKLYQFPLFAIRYTVDAIFTGVKILNIIGSTPIQTMDKRLNENLEFFRSTSESRIVMKYLTDCFTTNFTHYQESYFLSPDIFTESIVYNRYLSHCGSVPPGNESQEFAASISHILYQRGGIHFLNTSAPILQAELDRYRIDLANHTIVPERNQYCFLVTSNLKVFLGLFFYTDWIYCHENWSIPVGRCHQENQQLFSKAFTPENLHHKNMVTRLSTAMKFLLSENARKEKENVSLIQEGVYEVQTLTGQIYSMLPGTAKIQYMIKVRGDLSLNPSGSSSTDKNSALIKENPLLQYGYMNPPSLQQLAKLISNIEKSLNAL